MFTQTSNFRSEIVNTDCCGLRFNEKPNLNQSIFDEKITGKKSVLIGGSTAFGVGSSSDQKTISSLLSNSPDYHFYNLGGRAFNGFQELILYQSLVGKLNGIEKIVEIQLSDAEKAHMQASAEGVSKTNGLLEL